MSKSIISNKKLLFLILAISVILSGLLRVLNNQYSHTALLFIGLPALVAMVVIEQVDRPKTRYEVVNYSLTLFLLFSAVFLGEGIVCILFTAPIFYFVANLLVAVITWLEKKNRKLKFVIGIPIMLLLFQPHSFNQKGSLRSVSDTKIVRTSYGFELLSSTPDLSENLPSIFKLGFPQPISVTGEDMNIGSRRVVIFKSTTRGEGELVLEIEDRTDTTLTFKVISDDTHIGRWLRWEKFIVEKIDLDDGSRDWTWTAEYRCNLEPRWYFEPAQDYVVHKMLEHLLNSFLQ